MALEVKKKPKETSQSLVRRFLQRIRKSGILYRAQKIKFYQRPLSRQLKKRAALRREELRKEYEKMKKLGKVS